MALPSRQGFCIVRSGLATLPSVCAVSYFCLLPCLCMIGLAAIHIAWTDRHLRVGWSAPGLIGGQGFVFLRC